MENIIRYIPRLKKVMCVHKFNESFNIFFTGDYPSTAFNVDDNGIKKIADGCDEVANIVSEVTIVDGNHAQVSIQHEKTGEVYGTHIIQASIDRGLVGLNRQHRL